MELQTLVTQRKNIAKEMVMDPSNSDLMDKMEACQRKVTCLARAWYLTEKGINPSDLMRRRKI